MADYKQSDVAGTKWQRCFRIDAQNPRGGVPCIIFFEEEVFTLGNGEEVRRPVGHMQVAYQDPAKTFDVLNPMTGDVVGTATHGQVYALMHSLYLACAAERDNPPIEEPV